MLVLSRDHFSTFMGPFWYIFDTYSNTFCECVFVFGNINRGATDPWVDTIIHTSIKVVSAGGQSGPEFLECRANCYLGNAQM